MPKEKTPLIEGRKNDTQKPRWSLFPQGTLKDVLCVLELGSQKYAAFNWMKVPDGRERYYNALMRHVQAWWEGEKLDKETGHNHLSHAICCALFLLYFDLHVSSEKRA